MTTRKTMTLTDSQTKAIKYFQKNLTGDALQVACLKVLVSPGTTHTSTQILGGFNQVAREVKKDRACGISGLFNRNAVVNEGDCQVVHPSQLTDDQELADMDMDMFASDSMNPEEILIAKEEYLAYMRKNGGKR